MLTYRTSKGCITETRTLFTFHNGNEDDVIVIILSNNHTFSSSSSSEVDECKMSRNICGRGECESTASGHICHCHHGYRLHAHRNICIGMRTRQGARRRRPGGGVQIGPAFTGCSLLTYFVFRHHFGLLANSREMPKSYCMVRMH